MQRILVGVAAVTVALTVSAAAFLLASDEPGVQADLYARAIPPAHPVVPPVTKLGFKDATCRLLDQGLRYRVGDSPVASDDPTCHQFGAYVVWTTGDDEPIVRQRPSGGTPVARGTVVVLETACSIGFRRKGKPVCID